MMYESSTSSSPFDQALSKPLLLEEPAKKKWSLFSSVANDSTSSTSSLSSTNTSLDNNNNNDDYYSSSFSPSNRRSSPTTTLLQLEYEAPDLEEQGLMMMMSSLPEEALELDLAILRERHEEIQEIHGAMGLVHDIQKDLAMIVDSQDSYVKHLNAMAIEAYDEAEAGWAHIQAIHKGLASSSSASSSSSSYSIGKPKVPLYGMVAALVLIMGVYWFMMNATDYDGSGDMNGSPSSTAAAAAAAAANTP